MPRRLGPLNGPVGPQAEPAFSQVLGSPEARAGPFYQNGLRPSFGRIGYADKQTGLHGFACSAAQEMTQDPLLAFRAHNHRNPFDAASLLFTAGIALPPVIPSHQSMQ